ncbi:tryptophan halogenase [Sphingomonas guangdongensis]|uniref:Tryptophan halogenase n=1 Tax=Sphingomonas guangdongensis TaxID=1141890 RepID=A0A285QZT1_9SPHN|nr:tryptophan halogenase family protein [Sphingomonas guangdongensis]SOB87403.1 tryptophan halogenase [Sphingomonas guangdongensis]
MSEPIRDVVIVGGGTAGWMMAAAAARFLADGQRRITLVESEAIGTVGVGEATIPPIREFLGLLGIPEAEFVAATGATMKLGIEFHGWGAPGERYIHPFGQQGRDFDGIDFHMAWLKHRAADGIGPLEDYWLSAVAARASRFAPPSADGRSPLSQLAYAYHFDASRFAAYLRRRAEDHGVVRVEGRITRVAHDGASGHVAQLHLDGGRIVTGDLFIDCSGFRSLLLGDAMKVPFRDWTHWLPCDRAVAVPSARTEPLLPLTRAIAHDAGWRWRIPLQHRTGNGLVYASGLLSDDAATARLLAALDGAAEGEPRTLSFRTGRRDRLWEGNVVALGLAGAFLEPLESTSIHLIQSGIQKLFALFPDRGFAPILTQEYNRLMAAQIDAVRDFVILHYSANGRVGEPFWDALRTMTLPDTLATRLALFREKGRVLRYDDDLFSVASWVAVLIGQGVMPTGYDPLVDALDDARVIAAMRELRGGYARVAAQLPAHGAVVQELAARGAATG